jgi:hypothetical protein
MRMAGKHLGGTLIKGSVEYGLCSWNLAPIQYESLSQIPQLRWKACCILVRDDFNNLSFSGACANHIHTNRKLKPRPPPEKFSTEY